VARAQTVAAVPIVRRALSSRRRSNRRSRSQRQLQVLMEAPKVRRSGVAGVAGAGAVAVVAVSRARRRPAVVTQANSAGEMFGHC
jgi:hypothetical protein